jgi:hypothetical protein
MTGQIDIRSMICSGSGAAAESVRKSCWCRAPIHARLAHELHRVRRLRRHEQHLPTEALILPRSDRRSKSLSASNGKTISAPAKPL